jgi:flagellar protein FlbT
MHEDNELALKINVKAGERIVINGAVVTIGDGISYLVLQNHATFLREKDIMQEDEANTPAKRIYFHLLCMYLDQESYENYYPSFMDRMIDLLKTTSIADVRDILMNIFRCVQGRQFYQALKACRALVNFETELLTATGTRPARV